MEPTQTQTATQTPTTNNKLLFDDSHANNKLIFSSFPNGIIKKHNSLTSDDLMYRECLRNHAASIGGHALDGCGEFMPSPAANPAEPTSLRCAACGCHRNFHRRISNHNHNSKRLDEQEEEEEDDEDGDKEINNNHRSSSISPPPPSLNRLFILNSGHAHGLGANPMRPQSVMNMNSGHQSRKRFRTKFSAEQKEKMHELSERLGWRMQKRDEVVVEDCCRDIGITKGVFKVWMHNNKHHFVGGAGRRALAAGIQGLGNGHVLNGSSSSS